MYYLLSMQCVVLLKIFIFGPCVHSILHMMCAVYYSPNDFLRTCIKKSTNHSMHSALLLISLEVGFPSRKIEARSNWLLFLCKQYTYLMYVVYCAMACILVLALSSLSF